MDMTAWVKKGTREEVGVVVDYTNPASLSFLHLFITRLKEVNSD
jgi:hypothetical protein